MKKLISLILTFAIVMTMAGSLAVSADIPAGNGKGVSAPFASIAGTSPSSGTYVGVSDIEDTGFETAKRYIYKGGNIKSIVQLKLDFENTNTIATGDYVYISFYYRFNDDDTYNLPSYVQRRQYTNSSSGKLTLGSVSTDWQKASFVTTSGAAVASGTNIAQTLLIGVTDDAPVSMDIADPVCVYFGAVTGDDAAAQIQAEVDKSAFSSIKIGDTAIDLISNPASYTTEEAVATEDITAMGYYYNCNVKITSADSGSTTTHTITTYALDYNSLDSADTRYSTYTIVSTKAVQGIPVGDGKGVSAPFALMAGTSPSSGTYVGVSDVEDTGFETAKRYIYKGGNTKSIVQLKLDFENTNTIVTGDYVYISFYYRFNDDDTYNLPSYVQRRQYTNSSSGKLTIGSVSTDWQKASFITTSGAAVASGSPITQILLLGITNDAPVSMDIAEPQCVYFGAVTGDNAQALIQAEIDKSAFSSIAVGDVQVDLALNPASYITEETVAADDITAVGYHNDAIVKITSEDREDDVVYTITSYAVGYDFTDSSDTKYSTYTVTSAKPEPPISVNDGKGLSLEFDKLVRNTPSSGLQALINKRLENGFDTAYRYEYIEGTKSVVQLSQSFKSSQAVSAGDAFYMSFYYRFIDDDTYNLPASLMHWDSINTNTGTKVNVGSKFVADEWRKASLVITAGADVDAGTDVYLRYLIGLTAGDKFCMDIANPVCVYLGNVNADDVMAAAEEQVMKSDICEIAVNGTAIDLSANPESYTTDSVVAFNNVKVAGYHDPSYVDITSSVSGDTVTYSITAYALGYNFLDSADTHKSVYTITAKAPDYDLYSYDYSSGAEGYYVEALFDNNQSEAMPVTYIAAAYNVNEDLIGTNFMSITAGADSAKTKLNTTIEEIDETVCSIKVFAWDGMTDIKPLMAGKYIDVPN